MINVYIGSDTEEVYDVQHQNAPYNIASEGVTRVEAYVCGGAAELACIADRSISSDTSAVTWAANNVTFRFGQLAVPPGRYKIKIKFYKPATPEGFVVGELDAQVKC